MDTAIWGDIHFTPYEYDKMANLPSGYLMAEDPMDTRDIFSDKMQLIILFSTMLAMIVFLIGPSKLMGGDPSNRNFQDFLTVTELEEEIRRIREENSRLLSELKPLQSEDK